MFCFYKNSCLSSNPVVAQIKAEFIGKDDLFPIGTPVPVDEPIVAAGADGFASGVCTNELLRAHHDIADADELMQHTMTHL